MSKSMKLYSNPPTLERDENGDMQVVRKEIESKVEDQSQSVDHSGFVADLKALLAKYEDKT